MQCPSCGCKKNCVLLTRNAENGTVIRRRRKCLCCDRRFTTYKYAIKLTEIKEVTTKQEPQFVLRLGTDSRTYDPPLTGLNLRGKKYKRVFAECSAQLSAYFDATEKQNAGKITRRDVVCISHQIGLPLKTTCEFLEYLEKLPTGTWERKFAGISVKDWISMYAEKP